MENWEFFLQKVGTENWLKVDSPQPEFPQGRYFIAVCAAHRPQELIEVDISTRNNLRTRERIRQRQYTCQLDEAGFAILGAEIELTPGVWEIQCRGDLLSALMGENWQITLSLRVTLSFEKAATHFPSPRETPPVQPEKELTQLRSRLLDDADQMLQEIVDDLFPSFTPSPEWETSATNHSYRLHLDEEILVVQTAKPIIISGEITTQQQPPHPQLRLYIALRDPRTGDIVAELSPRLRNEPFPRTFCYSLTVPAQCESYLLEGELTLCDGTPQAEKQVFDHQSFTVSANWEKLEPIIVGAMSQSDFSHPPAPLSPLSGDLPLSSKSPKEQGIFPPKLSKAPKRKTPPILPNLPHTTSHSTEIPPPKEYVWSKPESPEEWELIPELVIIATDETES